MSSRVQPLVVSPKMAQLIAKMRQSIRKMKNTLDEVDEVARKKRSKEDEQRDEDSDAPMA